MDQEWDVLLVLDACRFDLFQEVVDAGTEEYIYSLGSGTDEWFKKTFEGDESEERLTYINANPLASCVYRGMDLDGTFSSSMPDESIEFEEFIEVWVEQWDEELGTVKPEAVTDELLAQFREKEGESRFIAHYLQPHHPFIGDKRIEGAGGVQLDEEDDRDVWALLRDGEVNRREVWEAYRSNLEYVMEEVYRVKEEIGEDATIVVTSDHGNHLGEKGDVAHSPQFYTKELVKVPWHVL